MNIGRPARNRRSKLVTPVPFHETRDPNVANDQPRIRPTQNANAITTNCITTTPSARRLVICSGWAVCMRWPTNCRALPAMPHQKQTSTIRKNSPVAERLRTKDFIGSGSDTLPIKESGRGFLSFLQLGSPHPVAGQSGAVARALQNATRSIEASAPPTGLGLRARQRRFSLVSPKRQKIKTGLARRVNLKNVTLPMGRSCGCSGL